MTAEAPTATAQPGTAKSPPAMARPHGSTATAATPAAARAYTPAEISARLGIPARSIGPTRRRCLDKLRHYPAIAALISADPQTTG